MKSSAEDRAGYILFCSRTGLRSSPDCEELTEIARELNENARSSSWRFPAATQTQGAMPHSLMQRCHVLTKIA